MKLGIVFSSAVFGLVVLATSLALAGRQPTSSTVSVQVPVEVPVTVEAVTVAASAYTVPTTTIVGSRNKVAKVSPRRTHWTCGDAHTMVQGPVGKVVKDCAWK